MMAGPLLFISMCTFIANDLNDREKDRINHPERPLPSGHITPTFAATLYFLCLAAALFTTRYCVEDKTAFWYYFLTALSISYGHVVEFLPLIKAPYVAAVISLPILIVASNFRDSRLYWIAVAIFLFNLGKELCMDVLDRPGDKVTAMHTVAPRQIALSTIGLQLTSLAVLLALSVNGSRRMTTVLLASNALLQALSAYHLLMRANMRIAIQLMRIELLVSLYFVALPSY